MQKPLRTVLGTAVLMVVVLIVVLGGFWLRYVLNTASPYDEVGIELNTRMPGPLRQWGCDHLHANFAGAIPPYGCATGDGTQWL